MLVLFKHHLSNVAYLPHPQMKDECGNTKIIYSTPGKKVYHMYFQEGIHDVSVFYVQVSNCPTLLDGFYINAT